MKVSQLKSIIKDMYDDDLLFVALFEKDEADEHAMSNLNDEKDFKFTDKQWEDIIEQMDRDEVVWVEITDTFRHYIEMKYNETKGKNDNSK